MRQRLKDERVDRSRVLLSITKMQRVRNLIFVWNGKEFQPREEVKDGPSFRTRVVGPGRGLGIVTRDRGTTGGSRDCCLSCKCAAARGGLNARTEHTIMT